MQKLWITFVNTLRLGMPQRLTRKAIKQNIRAYLDQLAAVMQPSIDLAQTVRDSVEKETE